MSNQTSAKAIAAAAAAADDTDDVDDVDALDGDLLRGGKRIAKFNYGSDKKEDVKRLYAEAHRLPVFQDVPGGPLLAFKSRLRKYYEALADARELELADAAKQRLPGVDATSPKPQLRINKPAAVRIGATDRGAANKSRHREKVLASRRKPQTDGLEPFARSRRPPGRTTKRRRRSSYVGNRIHFSRQ
jgi:hypothetical protein